MCEHVTGIWCWQFSYCSYVARIPLPRFNEPICLKLPLVCLILLLCNRWTKQMLEIIREWAKSRSSVCTPVPIVG